MSNEYIKKEDVLKFIEDIKCNKDVPKNYGTLLDIMRYIRKMPTYDVDKVIEKLKKNEEDAIKSIMENGKTEFHLIKITDLKELFEAYTKEQIEIVKSGGVADD